MKRLVKVGLGLLLVLALISTVGAASSGWLDWRVAPSGDGRIALIIMDTLREPLNYIEIYYWPAAGQVFVDSCVGVGSTPVLDIANRKDPRYWAKSVVQLQGTGLQPGGALICTLSKAGATWEEYQYFIEHPEELIFKIYGTTKR